MVGGCRFLAALLCLYALSAGVEGQGRVVWQYGMFGVSEGDGNVTVCANYSDAVEGFIVETSTTEVFALNGSDFLAQIGPTALLTWEANTTMACVSIPIVDDKRVENDEIFYVNMVRVVSSGATPTLEPQTIVIIMDDDMVPLVYTTDSITTTDDVVAVEVCVEVDSDLVDDNVAYRIPIAVETEGGTAEPGVDFEMFNNMTVGDRSKAVLTPPRPSHCFSISLLTRQDDRLDDRSFFISVMLRDGTMMITPPPEQIKLPEDLEVTVQPATQIEVGSITDSILSNPLFSVSLDMKGRGEDSNLCFEVHGESGRYLNLVSDACFSINARYEAIQGASGYNKIDELYITASDAAGGCSNILIEASQSCLYAKLAVHADAGAVLSGRYRRNGLQVEFLDGRVEITLPCRRYPGGGVKVVAKCNAEYQNPVTEERLPVKNLDVVIHRGKLTSSALPMPHGLVGQFWQLQFAQEPFTEEFVDGRSRNTAFKMTTPAELGSRSFVGLMYHLTWDLRNENCLYAGSRQAGTSHYVTSPADSVIEGEYTDYAVAGGFVTDYRFSVFPRNDFSCESV